MMRESDWNYKRGGMPILTGQDNESSLAMAASDAAMRRSRVDRVACRLGDSTCAAAHAGTLDRSARTAEQSTARSLMRLQRQYGNRYVGRVINRMGAGNVNGLEDVERSIEQARSGGQRFDGGVCRQMESAFGADFSAVRIHTDARADGLNQNLSARAFTTGQDVFFRQGEFNPGSTAGRELLAHELTHVVQQNGVGIQRQMTVSQPGDPQEQEADEMARAVMQREHAANGSEQIDPDPALEE